MRTVALIKSPGFNTIFLKDFSSVISFSKSTSTLPQPSLTGPRAPHYLNHHSQAQGLHTTSNITQPLILHT
ncbi:MAG: hypothetical protein L0922_00935, partial [Candidatus Mariimomonas ferrooxydans]